MRYKCETEFTMADFIKMEEIEKEYFLEEHITKSPEVYKWYIHNELSHIGVRCLDTGEVVASSTILPINKTTFEKIYNNEFNEVDIECSQIETYVTNNEYYLYLASISVQKEYREDLRVLGLLIKAFINLLNKLEEDNISIKCVMADVSTIHGKKMCEKLLNMEWIRATSHDTNIYFVDGDTFKKSMNRMRKHYKGDIG